VDLVSRLLLVGFSVLGKQSLTIGPVCITMTPGVLGDGRLWTESVRQLMLGFCVRRGSMVEYRKKVAVVDDRSGSGPEFLGEEAWRGLST